MDAVGQMIRESCHRPERVAAFLNKEQTDPVTKADVIRIAVSDKALKKAVGRRPYKIFLNKTDLMGKYESVERRNLHRHKRLSGSNGKSKIKRIKEFRRILYGCSKTVSVQDFFVLF